jgi:hypothetical protein
MLDHASRTGVGLTDDFQITAKGSNLLPSQAKLRNFVGDASKYIGGPADGSELDRLVKALALREKGKSHKITINDVDPKTAADVAAGIADLSVERGVNWKKWGITPEQATQVVDYLQEDPALAREVNKQIEHL